MFGSILLFFGNTGNAYNFKEALVKALQDDVPLDALISGRVEPQKTSQPRTLPAITYSVTREWGYDLDGRDGTIKARVTFAVYSGDLSQCETIVQALADAVGDLLQTSLSGVRVLSSSILNDPDSYIWPDDGSDDGTFMDSLTISFLYVNP